MIVPKLPVEDDVAEIGGFLVVGPVGPRNTVGTTESELPADRKETRMVVSSPSRRESNERRRRVSLGSRSGVREFPRARGSREKVLAVVGLKSPNHRVVELSLPDEETSVGLKQRKGTTRTRIRRSAIRNFFFPSFPLLVKALK